MTTRAADAAEMFIAGDRGGDERVQRRRSGNNRIALPPLAPWIDHGGLKVESQSAIINPQKPEGADMADRQYELIYILPPDTTEQQVTELHVLVEEVVTRMHGQIASTENWGRKRLAYEIARHKEGYYVLQVINGSGDLMKELDRRLKVMDIVIRQRFRVGKRRRSSLTRPSGGPIRSAGISAVCRRSGSRERRPAGDPDDADDDRFKLGRLCHAIRTRTTGRWRRWPRRRQETDRQGKRTATHAARRHKVCACADKIGDQLPGRSSSGGRAGRSKILPRRIRHLREAS
jgi:small subunit ribosomal protein S6